MIKCSMCKIPFDLIFITHYKVPSDKLSFNICDSCESDFLENNKDKGVIKLYDN